MLSSEFLLYGFVIGGFIGLLIIGIYELVEYIKVYISWHKAGRPKKNPDIGLH